MRDASNNPKAKAFEDSLRVNAGVSPVRQKPSNECPQKYHPKESKDDISLIKEEKIEDEIEAPFLIIDITLGP